MIGTSDGPFVVGTSASVAGWNGVTDTSWASRIYSLCRMKMATIVPVYHVSFTTIITPVRFLFCTRLLHKIDWE